MCAKLLEIFNVIRNISALSTTALNKTNGSKFLLLNVNSKHNFSACKDTGSSQSKIQKPKPAKAAHVPTLKLNNGHQMPVMGLGTWGSPKNKVYNAVMHAIDVGYRHIDCAHIYGNEKEVGAAIKKKIKEGAVKRGELFITSKLWNCYYRPDLVRGACEESLKNLGLSYLDMYLIHWPMAFKEENGLIPLDSCGRVLFSTVDYVDTWLAMEKLVRIGYCKSIGVSSFNECQLNRVLAEAKIIPADLQIECHPYLNQKKLIAFCKSKKIVVTAFSPLGSPHGPFTKPEDPIIMEDPKILDIAKQVKKTPAQILLRYHIQRGLAAIPKSVTAKRISSNFNIFDFSLSDDVVQCIDDLNRNHRIVKKEETCKHMHYPFTDDGIIMKTCLAKKRVGFLDKRYNRDSDTKKPCSKSAKRPM